MNLEDELRSALQRRDPPAGFAGRVLARSRASGARKRIYRAAAWAAAACLLLTAGEEYRRYREGARAKEQVLLALRIAGKELTDARQKIEKLTSQGGPVR